MNIPHEKAARDVYPNAMSFEPAFGSGRFLKSKNLIGWTFAVKDKEHYTTMRYHWVTVSGDLVSEDGAHRRSVAERRFRAFMAGRSNPGNNES